MNKNKRLYVPHQKAWWRNMNNIILNYRHKGEETDIRFIHMNEKCRIDIIMSEGIMRVTVVPSSIDSIKNFDIDEILDKEEMIDDDEVEVKLNLYFVKE